MGHRDQLLAAARTLLEERGYAHITARDLVAASGTNLASIGYHFGSKAALLNAAIEAAFEDWSDQLAELVMADDDATPIQRGIATWVAALESLPRRQPDPAGVLRGAGPGPTLARAARPAGGALPPRARPGGGAGRRLAGRDGRERRRPECRAVASFVIAACDGLAAQWLLDPDDVPTPAALLDGLRVVFDRCPRLPARRAAGDLAHGRPHVGEVDPAMTTEMSEIGPNGGESNVPNRAPKPVMASQAGLVSRSAAGKAVDLRIAQSTTAQTRSASRPQNST